MTEDEFRWAEALAIIKEHGDRAALFVAERLSVLLLAGDAAGVTRLRQIAERMEHILASERGGVRH